VRKIDAGSAVSVKKGIREGKSKKCQKEQKELKRAKEEMTKKVLHIRTQGEKKSRIEPGRPRQNLKQLGLKREKVI